MHAAAMDGMGARMRLKAFERSWRARLPGAGAVDDLLGGDDVDAALLRGLAAAAAPALLRFAAPSAAAPRGPGPGRLAALPEDARAHALGFLDLGSLGAARLAARGLGEALRRPGFLFGLVGDDGLARAILDDAGDAWPAARLAALADVLAGAPAAHPLRAARPGRVEAVRALARARSGLAARRRAARRDRADAALVDACLPALGAAVGAASDVAKALGGDREPFELACLDALREVKCRFHPAFDLFDAVAAVAAARLAPDAREALAACAAALARWAPPRPPPPPRPVAAAGSARCAKIARLVEWEDREVADEERDARRLVDEARARLLSGDERRPARAPAALAALGRLARACAVDPARADAPARGLDEARRARLDVGAPPEPPREPRARAPRTSEAFEDLRASVAGRFAARPAAPPRAAPPDPEVAPRARVWRKTALRATALAELWAHAASGDGPGDDDAPAELRGLFARGTFIGMRSFLERIGKGEGKWFTGENFSNTVSATARSKAGEYYARAPDA